MMDGDLAAMVMVLLVMSSPAFTLGFAELCRPHSSMNESRQSSSGYIYIVHAHMFK